MRALQGCDGETSAWDGLCLRECLGECADVT